MTHERELREPLRKRLGRAIRSIRKEKGISQETIGDSGNLSRLEKGRQWISEERLLGIAKCLDTPVWLLFAMADNALDSPLWQLMETYRTSDLEGRELIDHAVRVAKNKYSNLDATNKKPLKSVRLTHGNQADKLTG